MVSKLEADDVRILILDVLKDLKLITRNEIEKVTFATDLKSKYIEDNAVLYEEAPQL